MDITPDDVKQAFMAARSLCSYKLTVTKSWHQTKKADCADMSFWNHVLTPRLRVQLLEHQPTSHSEMPPRLDSHRIEAGSR